MKESLLFYNSELARYNSARIENPILKAKNFVSYNKAHISWSRAFLKDVATNRSKSFSNQNIRPALYRPFFKQHLYFSREVNNVVSRMDSFFPTPNHKNLVICVHGLGGKKEFSTIVTNCIPDLNCLEAGAKCFPLYTYQEATTQNPTLFDPVSPTKYLRRDAISNFILERAQKQYGRGVSKEDVFYYVYGFLHSPKYRKSFASDLKKMLPRLPLADDPKDFWAFSKAGRKLAHLHLDYETMNKEFVLQDGVIDFQQSNSPLSPVEIRPLSSVEMNGLVAEPRASFLTPRDYELYRVEKMRFPSKTNKSKIIFNPHITLVNIPTSAYEYVVNGKSAIEWVMERYQITTHKESGIVNNPNDWATEHNNPKYILNLLFRVISLSVETVEIEQGLPVMKFG